MVRETTTAMMIGIATACLLAWMAFEWFLERRERRRRGGGFDRWVDGVLEGAGARHTDALRSAHGEVAGLRGPLAIGVRPLGVDEVYVRIWMARALLPLESVKAVSAQDQLTGDPTLDHHRVVGDVDASLTSLAPSARDALRAALDAGWELQCGQLCRTVTRPETPKVIAEGLATMRALLPRDAAPTLAEMALSDPVAPLRQRAMRQLLWHHANTPAARSAVAVAADGPEPVVRALARAALRRTGLDDADREALARRLSDPAQIEVVAELLRDHGGAGQLVALRRALEDARDVAARGAVRAAIVAIEARKAPAAGGLAVVDAQEGALSPTADGA